MIKSLLVALMFISGLVKAQIPAINQQIVVYCKANEGKKIDRGECWDLAAFALNEANANWKPPFDFGKKYNFQKDSIFAGDIIQFENVEFKAENYRMTMPHHTAIVLEVLEDKKYVIAHQNFAGKRKVQFTEVNFGDLNKGKLQFYRPISK